MEHRTRREFIKQVGAGAVAAATTTTLASAAAAETRGAPAVATRGRVLGANDRINVGFVGCGGRMRAHITRIVERAKSQADVQAVAVNDIWTKRKNAAREMTGVDEKAVYHDFRELCARPDIDAVVIASPDHWHYEHTMTALKQGKHVYLEKPMTYTVKEAKEIVDAVKATGKVLQVGSQYTSLDHFWKAKKAIDDGLIGEVVWASGGFGRNSSARGGEWNYKIDPEANESNLDWKAFLGSAPKRAWDPARYFRWRKYWDYSGGIATDLFYHVVAPMNICWGTPQFPHKVMAGGGIYVFKDREVPDTFHLIGEYSNGHSIVLSSSMANSQHIPGLIRGHDASLIMVEHGRFEGYAQQITVKPEKAASKEYKEKFGTEEIKIPVEQVDTMAKHVNNFLDCMRSREQPTLNVETGARAQVLITMAVHAYREGKVLYFDEKKWKIVDKAPKA